MPSKEVLAKSVIRANCITLAVLFMTGCAAEFDSYSSSQIHRTVREQSPGHYVVHYEWRYVIEHYGPDMESQLNGAKEEQLPGIWKQAFALAVPRYLEAKHLIPAECGRGVEVLRNGETEGGRGWAEFQCK